MKARPAGVLARLGAWPAMLLVLAVALLLTSTAWWAVAQTMHMRELARFDARVRDDEAAVARRMDTYSDALRAGAAYFYAQGALTRDGWHTFVGTLDLPHLYPGAQGLGVDLRVPRAQVPALEARMRREGFGDFRVHPLSARPQVHAIVYLEPLDWRNRRAIGYDMFTDPVRHAAMARARDTGRPALSARVTLVQETRTETQPGFLLYCPIYRPGAPVRTVAERRAALVGFIYSPFRANDLFRGIFTQRSTPGIGLEIYDGARPTRADLLYDANPRFNGPKLPAGSAQPEFARSGTVTIAGRPWTMVFASLQNFEANSDRTLPGFTLLGGALVSLLLAAITWLLASSRDRAEAEAARRTEELRHANRELSAQKAMTERIITSVPIAIAFLDEQLIYRWNNPQHAALLGLPPERIIGRSYEEVLPAAYREQARPVLLGVLSSKASTQIDGVPTGLINPAQPPGYWDVRYVPFLGERGEPLGVLVITNEVTERVEKEVRQRAEIDTLHQLDLMKNQFLGILSHELRTPLNAIMGFASVLDDEVAGPLSPPQHTYLSKIMGGAEVLLALINDLLDMSRIQAGKFRLQAGPMDFAAIATTTLDHLRALADKKHHRLNFEAVGALPVIVADAQRVAQVVVNLVGNAIKFTPKGGAITVRACGDGDGLRVEVADSGIGIPPADQARLFQPFTQLDTGATRAVGGTGLGLSICKALVEAHGGTIGVDSTPGHGSTFWFTLPRTPVGQSQAGPSAA